MLTKVAVRRLSSLPLLLPDALFMNRMRRSVLYMPGANTRALDKAVSLDCDGLIFDLEDAVAPAAKTTARDNVVAAIARVNYGHRELIVRVNGLDTPWGADDVAAVAGLPIDGLLFPKIDTAAMLQAAAAAVAAVAVAQNVQPLPLWAMIESPRSVLNLEAISTAHPTLAVLVMGTSDLVSDLRAAHLEGREPLLYALSRTVTVARAYGLDALDGVHLDFRNLATFRSSCEQGRAMGFDGRSLIHPEQVDIANAVYGFSAADVEHARQVIAVWDRAQAQGSGVVELDGQLIENLHAAQAQRLLAMVTQLEQR